MFEMKPSPLTATLVADQPELELDLTTNNPLLRRRDKRRLRNDMRLLRRMHSRMLHGDMSEEEAENLPNVYFVDQATFQYLHTGKGD